MPASAWRTRSISIRRLFVGEMRKIATISASRTRRSWRFRPIPYKNYMDSFINPAINWLPRRRSWTRTA
jgi:hypothetical protein